MRGLADEDKSFLNESRNSIIGRKEKEGASEDKETEAICDPLKVFFGMQEHSGHHNSHG